MTNSPDPHLSLAADGGRASKQASAQEAQKPAAPEAAVGQGPGKGKHLSSKRGKPPPIHFWAYERTGPAITEAQFGDRKVRIFWPEPK